VPVILATQEVEIRRIVAQSQHGQIVLETLSRKCPKQKKRAGGATQGVGPEFKPQNYTHTQSHQQSDFPEVTKLLSDTGRLEPRSSDPEQLFPLFFVVSTERVT
jgi:hypothetical protein